MIEANPHESERLPPHYVETPDALDRLLTALLSPAGRSSISMTGLHGIGGGGKTVLAQAAMKSEAVARAFPDGVAWITRGGEPARGPVESLWQAVRAFGGELVELPNAWEAIRAYRALLRDKAALIVLDDVRDATDLEPFRTDSPASHLLFTTRDASIAQRGSRVVTPDPLTGEAAHAIFACWSSSETDLSSPSVTALIGECRGVPLALAISGTLVASHTEIGQAAAQRVLDALRNGTVGGAIDPPQSTLRFLKLGIAALGPTVRPRLMALAVLLDGMSLHPRVARVLWDTSEHDARETAELLVRRGLAGQTGDEGSIRIHGVVLDYVRRLYEDRSSLALIHGALRRSLDVIARDPAQFGSQLVGRLLPHKKLTGIAHFIGNVSLDTPRPRLRPLKPALRAPGIELLRTLEGHTNWVTAVAVTSDARFVVSGSADSTLKVWDLAGGRELRTLRGHGEKVNAVAVTLDNLSALSASDDGTVKLWDIEHGGEGLTLARDPGPIRALATTPDGQRIVYGSGANLRVLDLAIGEPPRTLFGHAGDVNAVSITPDGRYAVSASEDHTLRVWELAGGRLQATLRGHDAAIRALSVSSDGTRALSGDLDGVLKLWEPVSGREIRTFAERHDHVTGVAFTPSGRYAVSSSFELAHLVLWEIESGRTVRFLRGHEWAVWGVAVTADGRRAVSASADATLKVWELESSPDELASFGHREQVNDVAATPDGKLAVSGSCDGTLMVWDLDAARPVRSLAGHGGELITSVAVTPDGRSVVSAGGENFKIWDSETGRELRTFANRTGVAHGLSITPDGRRLLSAGWDETLRVWQVEDGKQLLNLAENAGACSTPGTRRAQSDFGEEALTVWDLESGLPLEVHAISGIARWVEDVVTWGGRRACIPTNGGLTYKLLDLVSGRELHELGGHPERIMAIAVTPDGRRAVSGSADGTINVWDLTDGRNLSTLRYLGGELAGLAISPGGSHAISSAWDNSLTLWDLSSGSRVAAFTCDGAPSCCAFASDRLVLAGDCDGRVYFLELELDAAIKR